ncbi:MAG: ankyrin repeat domain-containing protein [Lentisphaeria bacterium]|nr:ankyrin repeat domain-containing protein [Lentisphaeria bacterium]
MNTSFRNLRRWPFATILSARKYGYDNIFAPHGAKLGSQLCMSILRGDNREVRLMLDNGAPINHRDEPDGWTPLIYSIYYHNPEAMEMLLEKGADISATDFAGRSPLMIAAITGNDSLLKRFIEAGADPSVRDYRNKSALDFAAEFRNHKCVEILTGVVKS